MQYVEDSKDDGSEVKYSTVLYCTSVASDADDVSGDCCGATFGLSEGLYRAGLTLVIDRPAIVTRFL